MKLFILSLLMMSAAESFTVKFFAEPGTESRALEFIENMRELQPFKQLIEKGSLVIFPDPLLITSTNCHGGHLGIPRLAQCNLNEVKKKCQADLCPIFTRVPDIGAGGFPYPIVSSSFPWTTMLHEVVHTFGFTDEYAYTATEAPNYCQNESDWNNGYSSNLVNSFSTEDLAIQGCKRKISWCAQAVKEGAVVVQKNSNGTFRIGSPVPKSCPSVELGVYVGGSCQVKNPQGTWRPYFCPNIMGFPDLGEDRCAVKKRHKIIENSPNLLPLLYQQKIFNRIAPNLVFEELELPDLRPHTYGIPELDRLSGQSGDVDNCH